LSPSIKEIFFPAPKETVPSVKVSDVTKIHLLHMYQPLRREIFLLSVTLLCPFATAYLDDILFHIKGHF